MIFVNLFSNGMVISVVDPDPLGSGSFPRCGARIIFPDLAKLKEQMNNIFISKFMPMNSGLLLLY